MHAQRRTTMPATNPDSTVTARFYLPTERLLPYVTFFYFIEA